MQKLSCIIVEDEPLAAEVLVDYIQQIPFLNLVGNFPDALYALEAIKEEKVDVIFLDIHLPKLKGLDFIKTLKQVPQIILTTAYHQYAIESYELEVLDYLLKPIDFSRFLKAVNKLTKPNPSIPTPTFSDLKANQADFIFFQVNKKFVKVYLTDILYIESLKEYVRIHTKTQQLVTRYQIGEIEQLLSDLDILRIHRSFLVVKSSITAFSAATVEIGTTQLPIGRSYKALVMSELKGWVKG